MVWTWHPLDLLPKKLDVIWCRFPHRPALHRPADPPHPVLVRDIESFPELGEAFVHATYGTSNLKKEDRELLDLLIEKRLEIVTCGLSEPTRFDLDDRLNKLPIPWSAEFFPRPYSVGHLNEDAIRRLNNRLRDKGLPLEGGV